MTVSFTSLHARADDRDRVIGALRKIGALPAYVTKPSGGWVSLYPQATEGRDPKRVEWFAGLLAAALDTVVWGAGVRESDLFFYVLCEKDRVVDRYASRPASSELPEGGSPAALLPYCKPGTSIPQVHAALMFRIVGRAERSPEEQREFDRHMAAEKKSLASRYDEISRELEALGLPAPPLEQVMAQLDAVEDRLSGRQGEAASAEEQAGTVAALLGLPGQRALRGWNLLREGDPPPGALSAPVV